MNHTTPKFPGQRRDDATPSDHLERNCVIELPYLDAGRRVFVATDEKGWLIGHGMALSDAEATRVLDRLNAALKAHRERPRPTLLP